MGQLDNKNGTTENGGTITTGVRIDSILDWLHIFVYVAPRVCD